MFRDVNNSKIICYSLDHYSYKVSVCSSKCQENQQPCCCALKRTSLLETGFVQGVVDVKMKTLNKGFAFKCLVDFILNVEFECSSSLV